YARWSASSALVVEEKANDGGGKNGRPDVDDVGDDAQPTLALELDPELVAAGPGEEGGERDVGAAAGVRSRAGELLGVTVQVDVRVLGDEHPVRHRAQVGLEVVDGRALPAEANQEVCLQARHRRPWLKHQLRRHARIAVDRLRERRR